jgi:hypothetical protein
MNRTARISALAHMLAVAPATFVLPPVLGGLPKKCRQAPPEKRANVLDNTRELAR